MTAKLKRISVANRGEIAVRIINARRKLGLEKVLAVSAADRETMAASMANRLQGPAFGSIPIAILVTWCRRSTIP